jgi:hypothetical protein
MERREGLGAIRDNVWIASALGLVAVAAPLLIAAHYRALGIPRSDDWSYLLVQFRFVRDGTINLNNWVSMTLVGQVVLGAPVAVLSHRSITAMQSFTAVTGLVGLMAVVHLGRRLLPSVWHGAFVALMVAAGPLWGPLAASFMTDIPAFTLGMLSLLVGLAALRRPTVSLPLVAASLALGFVGFSIRQYVIVTPLAVVLTAAWVLAAGRDTRRLRTLAVLVGVFLVASAALFVWWRSLPQSLALAPAFPSPHSAKSLAIRGVDLFRLLGLLAAPAVVLAGPVRIVRRAWRAGPRLTVAVASTTSLALAGIYLHVRTRPFVGNYVARDGVLAHDVLDGVRPNVVPRAVFELLVLAGSLGAVLLVLAAVPSAVVLVRRLRQRELAPVDPTVAVVGLALAGYSAAYVVALATGLPLYDRYVLPLIPLAAVLVLRRAWPEPDVIDRAGDRAGLPDVPGRAPTRQGALAGAALTLVALAVVGVAYTADSASFDGTRWDVATAATRRGFTPLQINGGFEWDSYHLGFAPSSSRPPNSGTATRTVDPRERRLHYCVKMRVGAPLPGSRVVASKPFRAPTHGPARITAAQIRPCVPSG